MPPPPPSCRYRGGSTWRCPRDLIFLAAILFLLITMVPQAIYAQDPEDASNTEEEEIEPSRAIIFPWFAEALGIVIFYLTTRYVLVLPYTGIMFILGMFMGVGATRLGLEDHLTQSLMQWSNINYEVLLLVFLPGLVFNDSFGLDVHLFGIAFWQCILYAFPMVLGGTCLTALVGYYVFDFDWSFNLAMTFGSILSATDPAAVSALLEEVGAPPRLQIHIGGESLLNDGSAMVFFTIFSALFLAEIGIPGLGESIDLAEGFALFFRMSLGGAAIGMAFALALITVLYLFNRRLDSSESVVQVCSTITMAYLCYYTADSVCGASGVIATLTCGVLTQAFGSSMINNPQMMSAFWALVNNLLNTLLFTLGGLEFGGIISNTGAREGYWQAKEWGYLFLLWVLLHVIRFVLVYSFYPLTKRIGLSTNWKEAFFLSYGGLRGAVGISLGLATDNWVWSATEDETYRKFTTQLFGMVGGTAFLTLVINGSTAGPLLQKLGLAKSSETRQKVLQMFVTNYKENSIDDVLTLLGDRRFAGVDVKHVLQHLKMTEDDILQRYNKSIDAQSIKEDNIDSLLLSLRSTELDMALEVDVEEVGEETARIDEKVGEETGVDINVLTELRTSFVEQLRWAYLEQTANSELDGRQAFLAYTLREGLAFAADHVTDGMAVKDWNTSQLVTSKSIDRAGTWANKACTRILCREQTADERVASGEFKGIRFKVNLVLATLEAHRVAEENFSKNFMEKYPAEANQVVCESKDQIALANECLAEIDTKDVEVVTEHVLCTIALNKRSRYLEGLVESRLLSEKEAQEHIQDIEDSLNEIHSCSEFKQ